MNTTQFGGTKKKNTWRCVPADNIVIYNPVMKVTSIASFEETTTVDIYRRYMVRKCIVQTAVVCAISQGREKRCRFVEWGEMNY